MYLLTINSVEECAMLFYRNEIGELYDDILVGKVLRIELRLSSQFEKNIYFMNHVQIECISMYAKHKGA